MNLDLLAVIIGFELLWFGISIEVKARKLLEGQKRIQKLICGVVDDEEDEPAGKARRWRFGKR